MRQTLTVRPIARLLAIALLAIVIDNAYPQDSATLVFYRTHAWTGTSRKADVRVDGRLVCRLHNGRKCTAQVAPGDHVVGLNGGYVRYDIVPGTHYFRWHMLSGLGDLMDSELLEVPIGTGERDAKRCKE